MKANLYRILCLAIFVAATAGCRPSADKLSNSDTAGALGTGQTTPTIEELPAPATEAILLLTESDVAALGPANDLPAEWILPNSIFAQVIRPTRFLQYAGAPEMIRFFGNNGGMIPFWNQFDEIQLLMTSDKYAFVPLVEPQSKKPLGQRYPLPVKAIYVEKTGPIDRESLTKMAFSGLPEGVPEERTFGGRSVKMRQVPMQVPLDETGRSVAMIESVAAGILFPSENSAVIVHGPLAELERYFTLSGADSRGSLSQRIAHTDLSATDFAWFYLYEDALKQSLPIPVMPQLAESLLKNARAVRFLLNANATDGAPVMSFVAEAKSPESVTTLESDMGGTLMQLGAMFQSQSQLPDGVTLPEEMKRSLQQAEAMIKTVTMERGENFVSAQLPQTPDATAFFENLLVSLNQAAEEAVKGSQYEAVAQSLTLIGRLVTHVYYGKYNAFPPMAITAADGTPLLSWRVALLPAISPEGEALYREFKLDQPWNGPDNIKLLEKMPAFYHSPLIPNDRTKTTYRIFTRGGVPFGKSPGPLTMGDIPNPARTFLIVSTAPQQGVEWTRPDTLEFHPDTLGDIFGETVLAVPVMGQVFAAPFSGKPEEVKGLSAWILGQPEESDDSATEPGLPSAPPAPAETPAEVPTPSHDVAP